MGLFLLFLRFLPCIAVFEVKGVLPESDPHYLPPETFTHDADGDHLKHLTKKSPSKKTAKKKASSKKTATKLDDNLLPIIRRILPLAIYSIGFLVSVDNLGVSVSPILAGLGIGGLAVALAVQPTLSNFFAGTFVVCLLYTSPSPRDLSTSPKPSSA